jgi:hypothetical protein
MRFFTFELEQLKELSVTKPIDFQNEFNGDEIDAIYETLKFPSPIYFQSSFKAFPTFKNARRIELTFYIDEIKDLQKTISKIHDIVLGQYQIFIDFWFFASSKTKGLQLRRPRYIFIKKKRK